MADPIDPKDDTSTRRDGETKVFYRRAAPGNSAEGKDER